MRLTRKVENGYFIFCEIDASDGKPNVQEHVKKLGLYEDVDESPEHLAKIKRALEIIKKKRVDINVLIVSKNVDEYNKVRFILLKAGSSFWKLTQEEYDLLKEVLL